MARRQRSEILSISWNQNQDCFAIGTESGFAIWNSEPVREICRRDIGGIQHVEMFQRSSILALVGGGGNPFESANKVVIWNDSDAKTICHLEYRMPVVALKRRKDLMVVVTISKFFLYDFPDSRNGEITTPVFLSSVDTVDNPTGLFSTSFNPLLVKSLLAFPANTIGHVCLLEGLSGADAGSGPTSTKSKPPVTIKAHKSNLTALVLSGSGNLLATSSARGTLVRVFDTETRNQVYCLRRGLTVASVHSISFNRSDTMMCAIFDDTLYIWRMSDCKNQAGGLLSLAEQYLPNFDEVSTSAFAQIRIRAGKAYCAFEVDKTSILTLSVNGTARKYKYHDSGMQATEFYRLLTTNNGIAKLLDVSKRGSQASVNTVQE